MHPSSSSSSTYSDVLPELSSTYEATKARQSIALQPDPIHWNSDVAFRDCPYRQLHHQQFRMGTLRVRLLEGSNLQRNYWSALALGPVKLLGLSKAHGAVSSFCSLHLAAKPSSSSSALSHTNNNNGNDYWDRKPAAKPPKHRHDNVVVVRSPVVADNDNPVWDQCQFEFPLVKGFLQDGQRLCLELRVDEDGTAVENFLPGVPGASDSRLLGCGSLDLTELLLGETAEGEAVPNVKDAWIPISLKDHELEPPLSPNFYDPNDPLAPPPIMKSNSSSDKNEDNNNSHPSQRNKLTGTIRVLVSYTPYGLEPQRNDVVGLEAFARRDPHHNSLRPLLPPLMPLTVLDRRGSYLLLEYSLAGRHSTTTNNSGNNSQNERACVRLHRNAVFVLERQNMVDAATNLVLLPTDVAMSTPLGRAAADMVGPIVHASQQVCMPALLSVKLVWMALRTTTLASFSGVQALGATLWHEGSTALTTNDGHPQHGSSAGGGAGSHHQQQSSSSSSRHHGNVARAQYVQL